TLNLEIDLNWTCKNQFLIAKVRRILLLSRVYERPAAGATQVALDKNKIRTYSAFRNWFKQKMYIFETVKKYS
ncbi:MAG: hypothetical protein ACK5LR_04400, partial [Mangrovibacterium sp.]